MTQFPKLLEWSCTYAKLQISIFAPDLLYLCSFTILFLLLIKLSSLLTSFSPFLGFIWLFYGVFLNEDIVHKALFFFPANCVQFSSVTQSCPTLCDRMDYSTPGFPIHHQFPELTQTHICWISDAIQLPHAPSSPSPHALNLCQHQVLFQWDSSSHQVAKVTYVTITLLFSKIFNNIFQYSL